MVEKTRGHCSEEIWRLKFRSKSSLWILKPPRIMSGVVAERTPGHSVNVGK